GDPEKIDGIVRNALVLQSVLRAGDELIDDLQIETRRDQSETARRRRDIIFTNCSHAIVRQVWSTASPGVQRSNAADRTSPVSVLRSNTASLESRPLFPGPPPPVCRR